MLFFPPVIEIFLARHRAASHSPPQCSYERENLRVSPSPWRKIDKPQPGLVIPFDGRVSAREDRRSTHPSIPSPSGPSGLLRWSLWVRIRRMTSGQDHGLVVLTGRRWYSIYRRTDELLSRNLKSRRERKDAYSIAGHRPECPGKFQKPREREKRRKSISSSVIFGINNKRLKAAFSTPPIWLWNTLMRLLSYQICTLTSRRWIPNQVPWTQSEVKPIIHCLKKYSESRCKIIVLTNSQISSYSGFRY